MKIWTISDLHLEVEELEGPLAVPADADVCVIAGDLINKSPGRGIEWIARNIPMPAVYVAGNHEHYRGYLADGLAEARAATKQYPDVHFLEDDLVLIDGIRFIGATLWTDFRLMGNPDLAMHHAGSAMNDYRAISMRKEPWQRLTPISTVRMHEKSRQFISDAMDIPHDGPTVVVTHHCPHPDSIHPRYRGDLLNAAFCSDLGDLIENRGPDLWLHGHTHSSFDYVAGNTRVVCNPRGYGRENKDFDPGLVIEIGKPYPNYGDVQ